MRMGDLPCVSEKHVVCKRCREQTPQGSAYCAMCGVSKPDVKYEWSQHEADDFWGPLGMAPAVVGLWIGGGLNLKGFLCFCALLVGYNLLVELADHKWRIRGRLICLHGRAKSGDPVCLECGDRLCWEIGPPC